MAKKGKGGLGTVGKRSKGEIASGYNATIVAVTICCGIARNGRKSRRSFAPPREIECQPPSPLWMGHQDRSPGPLDSREGGGEGTSRQDLDNRGNAEWVKK